MQTEASINLGNLLLSLSDAVDLANPYIAQHQLRTAFIAWKICRSASLPDEQVSNIFVASLLHDIGAISIEEKVSLHSFEEKNINLHCIKSELLFGRVPEFAKLGKYVRYHHTDWTEWEKTDGSIETDYILASQIIYLADLIERLIKRDVHILLQVDSICEHLRSIKGKGVNGKIVDFFLDISRCENIWLDIVSPRIYSLLFFQGPLWNKEIGNNRLEEISKLFRDIIDFKSPYTATHTSGVAACTEGMSRLYGFCEYETQSLRIAGNLHDLGKLAVPAGILNKPGALSREEYAVIKSHTYYSYNVISSIKGLTQIAEWASFHHERLDGTGYPFHIMGRRMTIGSRIMAVADIFTALTEARPYRKGMDRAGIGKIMNEMGKNDVVDRKIVSLLFDEYDRITESVVSTQAAAMEFYTTRMENIQS